MHHELLQSALRRIDELTPYNKPDDKNAVIRAKLRALMRGYAKRWNDTALEILAIEQSIDVPLYNPQTQATSRTFRLAGKEDLLVREDGYLWLWDHKTTSEDIGDPNSTYWRQLIVEAQHQHYMLLEHINGRRVDGALWDVIRKPSISPRQITKAENAQIAATGLWFGDPAEPSERETPAMYEARVAYDCTHTRPDWYFQRRRIARLDHGLLEYAGELWQHSQDLLWSRRNEFYPRNSGACMDYSRACRFLPICSGYDDSDSANWVKKASVHPEIEVAGDGRDVLTNSRIRCFQTCRRKHYFAYELGIERAEPEDTETLYFGTIWHGALEVWFAGLKGEK